MMLAIPILSALVAFAPPAGPHAVGTTTHTFVDEARGRELVVQLVHPAARQGKRAPYFPGAGKVAAHLRSLGGRAARAADGFDRMATLETHALAGAPFPPGKERYPLVLLSPGGNMSRHFYTGLAEGLASHGYAVALISHPGMGLDLFSKGVVASEPRWEAPRDADQAARDAHFEPMTELLAGDARFVLDKLAAFDRLDLTKVAAVGHSRGGKTVSRLCTTDKRCRAGVILDNLPPAADRKRGYDVPLLLVRAASWEPDEVAAIDALIGAARAPLADAAVTGAAHMSFSDAVFLDPERFESDLPPARGLELTLGLTRDFLDRHLRGVRRELRKDPEVLVRLHDLLDGADERRRP